MKIEVLGTGCAKCAKVYAHAEEAVKRSGVDAELVKVTSLQEIAGYGVMRTPALVIDGTVKGAGKVPSVDEIVAWIS